MREYYGPPRMGGRRPVLRRHRGEERGMGLRVASDRTAVRQQDPRRGGAGDGVWRGRRAGVFSAARLALLRLTRGWRLLIGMALGMVVAVVLVCTVPLYDALVIDLQLQRTLSTQAPAATNV